MYLFCFCNRDITQSRYVGTLFHRSVYFAKKYEFTCFICLCIYRNEHSICIIFIQHFYINLIMFIAFLDWDVKYVLIWSNTNLIYIIIIMILWVYILITFMRCRFTLSYLDCTLLMNGIHLPNNDIVRSIENFTAYKKIKFTIDFGFEKARLLHACRVMRPW